METMRIPRKLIAIFLLFGLFETSKAVYRNKAAVVEVLIVYDKVFTDQFDNNQKEIKIFWHNQMWEAYTRFKTLVNTSVDIRLVDMIEFTGKQADQYYGVKYPYNFLEIFSEWLYQKINCVPNFDIALLAVGTNKKGSEERWSNAGRICQINHYTKQHLSFTMLHYHRQHRLFSLTVTQSIAEVLGSRAPEFRAESCGYQRFPFITAGRGEIGRFFLSRCADEAIAIQLQEETSQCVFQQDSWAIDLLEENIALTTPASMHHQCRIESKDLDAYAAKMTAPCVGALCLKKTYSWAMAASYGWTTVGYIFPADNSPCATDSHCFRGLCLTQGYQIQSVKLGTCIQSSNKFNADDPAIVTPCTRKSTPVETLRIEESKPLGWRLMNPFSKPYSAATHDKCLVLEQETTAIRFRECSANPEEYWQIDRVDSSNNAFLLVHVATNSCLTAHADAALTAILDCNSNDTRSWWQFYDGRSSSGLFPSKFDTNKNPSGFCFTCWLKKLLG